MALAMDIEAPLGIAALVHNFEFRLTCPPDLIVREFFSEPAKVPMIFTHRKK